MNNIKLTEKVVDNLMNEARADERSKVIGEIEAWIKDSIYVIGIDDVINPESLTAKLNEMKNVPIQKT